MNTYTETQVPGHPGVTRIVGKGAGYGFGTIRKADDGTWTAGRSTWKGPWGDGPWGQEEAKGLSYEDALTQARTWTDVTGPARTTRPVPACHWCGCPLTRRGDCEECGEQF